MTTSIRITSPGRCKPRRDRRFAGPLDEPLRAKEIARREKH